MMLALTTVVATTAKPSTRGVTAARLKSKGKLGAAGGATVLSEAAQIATAPPRSPSPQAAPSGARRSLGESPAAAARGATS